MKKKVAFIMTVYRNDKLEYFKEAVESIAKQDYGFENINIYLGIDGKIPNDIEMYINENSNAFYKIIRNSKNMGLAYTLNRLIENLEDEEYIFRMDSDDICRNDRVSKQMNEFKKNKELVLIGSDIIEIDENNQFIRYKKMPINIKEIIKYSIVRNPFNHPTVAFKKEFFTKVGLYNESYIKSQDYELWSRALKKGIIVKNINSPLLYFRITNNYISKRNSFENYINEYKISMELMKFFKMYNQLPKIYLKLFIRMMPSYIGKIAYKIIRNKIT